MQKIFLIAGLGNPGAEYAKTRHNIGFMLVEKLAARWSVLWNEDRKFKARIALANFNGNRAVLSQPLTFMNASGVAVAALRDFYKVPVEQVLIVVDDADLPFGAIRMRGDGSPGGHHGLESIETHLGTKAYARLRLGIGRKDPARRDIKDYVLGRFGADEQQLLEKVLERAACQVESWLNDGPQKAMSLYNGLAS